MSNLSEPSVITWVIKRESLSKLWVEKERGIRRVRGGNTGGLKTEEGPQAKAPLETRKGQEKKKAFSKVSGKEVSPTHTFMLARETHISLLPSRTVL